MPTRAHALASAAPLISLCTLVLLEGTEGASRVPKTARVDRHSLDITDRGRLPNTNAKASVPASWHGTSHFATVSPHGGSRSIETDLAIGEPEPPSSSPPIDAGSTAASGTSAYLTLVMNTVRLGEEPVLLRDDDVLIGRDALTEAGLIVPANVQTEQASSDSPVLVSLRSLAPAVAYEMDERDLELRLTVRPSMLKRTLIDLHPAAPKGLLHARDTSAFLNYAPRLTGMKRFDAFLEAGISSGDRLLFSSVSYNPDLGAVRGMSNITTDDRKNLRRWIVGDAFVTTGPLGAAGYFGGVTVMRSFELDPYLARTPTFGMSSSVATPSTLDVYVNGALVKHQAVAPGPVTISNLPVTAGAGVATYVLRDAFGREQSIVSPYYLSPGLLAKDLTDYAVSVGARRDGLGVESFGYRDAAALARYRVGLSNSVTAGMRIEGTPELASMGASVTTAAPGGELTLALSGSSSRELGGVMGGASALSYARAGRSVSFGALVRALSPRYATVSTTATDDRALFESNGFVSVPLARNVTMGATGTADVYRDNGWTARANLTSTIQPARSLGLTITAGRSWDQSGRADVNMFASLTYLFGGSVSASLNEQVQDHTLATTASFNKPLPAGTGYGLRGDLTESQGRYQGDAFGQLQGQMGRVEAGFTANDQGAVPVLSAAGALVAVEGVGGFATRPVEDGMVVVHVEGAKGVRVYLDNQMVGRTDSDGDLLIPNLLAYYGNRLRIADGDLPMDYAYEGGEQVFAPPYRGAAVIRFAAKRTLFVRGTFFVPGGKPPAYGDLVVDGQSSDVRSPVGAAGEFELEGILSGKVSGHVEYQGGSCFFTVTIKGGTSGIAEIGKVPCVPRVSE